MNESSPIREHLSDRVPGRSLLEQRAGELLHEVARMPTVDSAMLARLAERVHGRPSRQPLLRFALAGAALFVVAGAVVAAVALRQRVPPPSAVPPAAAPAGPAVDVPSGVTGPSSIAEESRLLGAALHQLRQQRDAQAALAALDEYDRRFPSGTLAREATLARLDTLLELDERTRALDLLERTRLADLPRVRELTVLRGELRGTSGRCAQAITDFASAIDGSGGTLEERALWGRASCRARAGDRAGARADLQQIIVRFPEGHFAAQARQALHGR